MLLVVSEGQPRDFADVVEHATRLGFGGGVQLMLGGDPRTAFRALVDADALVVAKSAFSYAAGLLSRGAVYSDLARGRWGWNRPLKAWARLVPAAAASGDPQQVDADQGMTVLVAPPASP